MVIEKKDRNFIIDSSLNRFKKYAFISYDYVDKFIEAILNEEKDYDGINIVLGDTSNLENAALFVELKLLDYLYLKVCRVAQEEADVLIDLVDDLSKKALLIFKKMGVTNTSTCEDYLIDTISNYDGTENFSTYCTRYLMAKIKGIEYVKQEVPVKKPEEQVYVPRKYNKKKPKKPKNKDKKKNDLKQQDEQNNSPLILEEDNVCSIDSTPLDEENISELPVEEVVNELNEAIIDLSLFDCGIIKEITLPKTIYDEFVKDIEYTTDEQDKDSEEKVLNIEEVYAKCQKLCGNIVGNAVKETFLELATSVNIIEAMPTNDEQFLMYLILRFGRINDSYFEIDEIGKLLGVEQKVVLNYEKIVIENLKIIINNKFNNYSLIKFKKGIM